MPLDSDILVHVLFNIYICVCVYIYIYLYIKYTNIYMYIIEDIGLFMERNSKN